MVKQIKKLTMLLFVAVTMLAAASCSKDDDSGRYPESVQHTTWEYTDQSHTHEVTYVAVSFLAENTSRVTLKRNDGTAVSEIYRGTYTYSKGSGTLDLVRTTTGANATATFSVDDSTLTLKFNGGTYSLTRQI